MLGRNSAIEKMLNSSRDAGPSVVEKHMAKLEEMFENVYVINLNNRPDRLKVFFETIDAKGWPFQRPRVWEAVPGGSGKVPCPTGFTEGGGAFGCRQSHVGILEHCLMHDINSVLILEDDATIMSSFVDDVEAFIELVPDDWEGIMLGGQHHQDPTRLREGLVKVNYAQRTQAYACRGEYMRGLYARWAMATVHIDWLMQGWQSNYKVYAPERWLIGQARSKSDICGRSNAATFWNSVTNEGPVILLKAPREVMQTLRDQYGLHAGYTRNDDDIDVGLAEVFAQAERTDIHNRLQSWINTIQYECGQTEHLICTESHEGHSLFAF
jgi:GR25 family glycosyltransferase involved in LPS biosynthesis